MTKRRIILVVVLAVVLAPSIASACQAYLSDLLIDEVMTYGWVVAFAGIVVALFSVSPKLFKKTFAISMSVGLTALGLVLTGGVSLIERLPEGTAGGPCPGNLRYDYILFLVGALVALAVAMAISWISLRMIQRMKNRR